MGWTEILGVLAGSWAVLMTGAYVRLRRRHLALRKHYRALLREREQGRFSAHAAP